MAGNPTVVNHMRAIGKICRDTFGLRVVEVSGWTTRGRSSTMNPAYTIEHHTAAPVDITNMLINGRPDLSGPLCNFELRKDGTIGLLASGRANHAGVASVSSTESYGIEATGPIPTGNTGADAFPNYRAYVGLVAAICAHHGWGMDRVKAHKEIAPTRKIDPVFDMDAFRSAVRAAMAGKTIATDVKEWWEMPIGDAELDQIQARAEVAARKVLSLKDSLNNPFGTVNNDNAVIILLDNTRAVGAKVDRNLQTFLAMAEAGFNVDLGAVQAGITLAVGEAAQEALADIDVGLSDEDAERLAEAFARKAGERLIGQVTPPPA